MLQSDPDTEPEAKYNLSAFYICKQILTVDQLWNTTFSIGRLKIDPPWSSAPILITRMHMLH